MSTPDPEPIICECGHLAYVHGITGCCEEVSAHEDGFCKCNQTELRIYKSLVSALRSDLAAVQAERDALVAERAKLEEAVKRARGQLDAGLAALYGSNPLAGEEDR